MIHPIVFFRSWKTIIKLKKIFSLFPFAEKRHGFFSTIKSLIFIDNIFLY